MHEKMSGRTSLVEVTLSKWQQFKRPMQVTISAWSPTLLEVKLHSMPASLLVSTHNVLSDPEHKPHTSGIALHKWLCRLVWTSHLLLMQKQEAWY